MSFQQIAKLYLRGSAYSKGLKNMPQEQVEEINDIIEELLKEPSLQHVKYEFCGALSRTIRNEYSDFSVGLQDYRIAIMRTVVATKVDPDLSLEKIMDDPIQRKKWFQTWIFNYLKQILNENKIPAINNNGNKDLVVDEVSNILSRHQISHNIIESEIFLEDQLTDDMRECIDTEIKKYFNDKAEINFSFDRIKIGYVKNVIGINEYSFNNEDDNVRNHLESQAASYMSVRSFEEMDNEIIDKLKERMPDYAKPVLGIYLENERPNEYVVKYGEGRPCATHISRFLGISLKEVKRIINLIKIHLMVLQLGY